MIAVNELRIGNYVSNYPWFEVLQITFVNAKGAFQAGNLMGTCNAIQGTPLTKGWLEKLGFEKGEGKNNLPIRKIGALWIYIDDFTVAYFGNVLSHIEYVHQLQNLYFALTGEELVLKS